MFIDDSHKGMSDKDIITIAKNCQKLLKKEAENGNNQS